jgi:predicted RNase H-like HicB family nuclease
VTNEFTAIIQQADGWYLAFSSEMPAANGQGRTREEALESLASAIDLVLQDLLEESLSQYPPECERAVVRVG